MTTEATTVFDIASKTNLSIGPAHDTRIQFVIPICRRIKFRTCTLASERLVLAAIRSLVARSG